MQKLYILVGLPGSGKSTFAQKLASETGAVICSSDAMRKRLYGDENIQGNPNEVFSRLKKDTLEYLSNGKSVIYDATNITVKSRKSILTAVKDMAVYKCAIVMLTPYEICVERAKNRVERVVPEDVILRMKNNFRIPSYSEGFDSIEIYRKDDICT